jgi:hypothetical protein
MLANFIFPVNFNKDTTKKCREYKKEKNIIALGE